jgi:Zn-finger nucleic acid-binding protein
MKCPIDGATLVMSNRNGIEIDYCPECRGVWLDRGELDKVIERESEYHQPQPSRQGYDDRGYQDSRRPDQSYGHKEHYNDRGYQQQKGYHKKKKSSFLGELFEFGD